MATPPGTAMVSPAMTLLPFSAVEAPLKVMPPPNPVTAAAPNAAGRSVITLTTAGTTVSVTVKVVTVAVPMFCTITRYVTMSPIAGAAGVCSLTAEINRDAGATEKVAGFENPAVVPQADAAATNAVLPMVVGTQTEDTAPVTVNV